MGFLRVSTPLVCPIAERVGLQWSRCWSFAVCGLLLFYLLTPVCCCLSGHSCFAPWAIDCLFLWIFDYCLFHPFNWAENPTLLLSDQSNPSSPASLVSYGQRALLLSIIFSYFEVFLPVWAQTTAASCPTSSESRCSHRSSLLPGLFYCAN